MSEIDRNFRFLIEGTSYSRGNASVSQLLADIRAWESEVTDSKPVDEKTISRFNLEGPEITTESATILQYLTRAERDAPLGSTDPVATLRTERDVPSGSTDPVITKLRSMPTVEPLLPTLGKALLSPRGDDEVSEEVMGILGYDQMDLVFEVLNRRQEIGKQLLNHNKERPVPPVSYHAPAPPTLVPHGRGGKKGRMVNIDNAGDGKIALNSAEAKRRIQDSLKAAASRPLFSGLAEAEAPVYPHVYTSSGGHGSVLSSMGSKFLLPLGTTRHETEEGEEVIIPPAKPVPPKISERLISVDELEPLARGSFPGYKTLNRIQSIIYPTAYKTNENLLICAPTGAGKTDIAVLAILRVLDQHRSPITEDVGKLAGTIKRDDFKIIYVAPMKALASEITRKVGKRLAWLNIRVRELTGDMQLTKEEIATTQIIVTTPEKWDVVTRKPTGEGELASKVKLLIIDEVHLLNEERGAVIETIVARTLRQVESSQSIIRVVGLSATLPNYIDVADFLSVSRQRGLFFFDSSFRPVPLEQHFIGIKGKTNSPQQRKNLDRVTHEKVTELVREGHQVMVFVHARKETVKSALALKEAVLADGEDFEAFDPTDHPQWDSFRRDIGTSRNKEMKELFDHGFGIHHAGMLRSDRNMMERMFEARAIKVLFCTATLAWGVNLPAHAVLIKGTQVYDSAKGSFVDLSVLDVLQIFGRAGRPGMETSGVGYICTPDEKLDHYLNAVTSQHPIESRFISGIIDSLNAEISLGTVTNVTEGVQWLGYTYLFVRMRKNPLVYGMTHAEPMDDPQLGAKRVQLIITAAKRLAKCGMIRFDEPSGSLSISDLGRIAAKYYIRQASIEIFNEKFKSVMSEADVLGMLSMSTEFDQIQVRENELPELKVLMEDVIPCEVKGGIDSITSQGKVNVLLQGHISRAYVEDFALVSDTAYAAQNGGRIIRALFEIALSRKWANVSAVLMAMSKAVEKRMWPFEHPLTQSKLSQDLLYNLQRWADELSVVDLAAKSAVELGQLVHLNEKHGLALLNAAKQFPTAHITYLLRPLTSDLLKIIITVRKAFKWSKEIHGSGEPFWIWVEDVDGVNILQWAHLLFRQSTEDLTVDFLIPVRELDMPPSVTIRFISDRWLGAEEEVVVELEGLTMPQPSDEHSPLLDIPFLSFKALRVPQIIPLYSSRYNFMNGMQTQSFWTLHNTSLNTLICAPTASGKTLSAHVAIWRAFAFNENCLCLVISARKTSARDFTSSLRPFVKNSGMQLETSLQPDDVLKHHTSHTIRTTTSACLLRALSRSGSDVTTLLSSLSLVIFDDLDAVDGASEHELAISILLHLSQSRPIRIIGLSASVNDPADLAAWLRVPPEAIFAFRPSAREQELKTVTQTFTIPHSAALFKAMAKPTHDALRAMPLGTAGIVFVPSRTMCRTVATELVTQCANEMETRGFLGSDVEESRMEYAGRRLKDPLLVDPLMRGIGIYYDAMASSDKLLVLELFADGVLRVLVVPRECCWTLPARAGTIVAMGTQYVQWLDREHAEKQGDRSQVDRQVKNYSIPEVIRMQSRAVQHGRPGRFYLFCQAEERDTFKMFLDQGLPLESTLKSDPAYLMQWVKNKVNTKEMIGKQDLMDFLSFTLLYRRTKSNPVYYDGERDGEAELLSRFSDDLWLEQGNDLAAEQPSIKQPST